MPESRRKQEENIDQLIKAVRKELQGPVNKTIDHLLHPHFHKYPFLIIIDGLLHGLNEMDPAQSIGGAIALTVGFADIILKLCS